MAKFPSEAERDRIISGMKWMGILSSEKATVTGNNLLDTLCAQLEKLMSFKPGERDLVMLQHKFVVEWSDQKMVRRVLVPSQNSLFTRRMNSLKNRLYCLTFCSCNAIYPFFITTIIPDDLLQETFTSTLELLGDPKRYSGMSLAVGVTCGIATQLLLDGHPALTQPGVLAPYEKEICDPIRALVEKEGVKMVERTVE